MRSNCLSHCVSFYMVSNRNHPHNRVSILACVVHAVSADGMYPGEGWL